MAVRIMEHLDKVRKFTLDIQTVRIAEQSLGVGIQKAAEEKMGPTFFITVLWAGLTSKAIKKKSFTMYDLQKFVLIELGKSDALSGYEQDEDEESADPLESQT